jgi:hypothetical protein
MTISEQKRLIKRFYLVSMFFNVILPLLMSRVIIGDKSGEVQLLFVAAIIWGFTCMLVYGAYFFIPEFQSKRDVVATFMLPSMVALIGSFFYLGFMYLLIYTILINLSFLWIWNRKTKKCI